MDICGYVGARSGCQDDVLKDECNLVEDLENPVWTQGFIELIDQFLTLIHYDFNLCLVVVQIEHFRRNEGVTLHLLQDFDVLLVDVSV